MRPWLAALCLVLGSGARALAGDVGEYRPLELAVPRERVALQFARFDDDERADLLIARETSFELRLQQPDGSYARGPVLDIGDSLGGALFQVADLDGDRRSELYLLHRTGIDVYRYRPAERDWTKGAPLLTDQRGIAFLHLAPAEFLSDGDGDGSVKLSFPADRKLYVYGRKQAGFELIEQRDTPPARIGVRLAGPELALRNSARIELPRPPADPSDPRGRATLRVGNVVSLSSDDGSGLSPGSPGSTASEDDPLAVFRRRHDIEIRGTDTFQSLLRDLDGDGQGDYTIVYGNRIWVYKGAAGGFDFNRAPDQLLKVSGADRMGALLLPLNADERPDLVLFKYEQPSFARLVAALAIGLRAEIEVLGYENDGDPVFARKPSARSTFVISVPPLLQLAGRLEQLVGDFRDAFRPIRSLASGDFDGDGTDDVVRVAASGAIELYTSERGRAPIDLQAARASDFLNAYEGHKLVRKVLFDKERKNVDLESAVELVRDAISQVQVAVLGGREPSRRIPVDPQIVRRVDQVLAQDLDGDGRADIILFPEPPRVKKGERDPTPVADRQQTLQLWLSRSPAAPATVRGKPE